MATQYHDFWGFIRLLNANGLANQVVVIGSWAEYVYAQAGTLAGFEANLRTLDIDFMIRNMRKPAEPVNIITLAKKEGYIVEHDTLMGTTKFITPTLMGIEFLIPQYGSGESPVISTNLGVKAQALRHLNILRDNIIVVELFDMQIHVPTPEAYAIHKMVINKVRGKKAEKDRVALVAIMPFLDKVKFREIYDVLTKKERASVDDFLTVNNMCK